MKTGLQISTTFLETQFACGCMHRSLWPAYLHAGTTLVQKQRASSQRILEIVQSKLLIFRRKRLGDSSKIIQPTGGKDSFHFITHKEKIILKEKGFLCISKQLKFQLKDTQLSKLAFYINCTSQSWQHFKIKVTFHSFVQQVFTECLPYTRILAKFQE